VKTKRGLNEGVGGGAETEKEKGLITGQTPGSRNKASRERGTSAQVHQKSLVSGHTGLSQGKVPYCPRSGVGEIPRTGNLCAIMPVSLKRSKKKKRLFSSDKGKKLVRPLPKREGGENRFGGAKCEGGG